MSVPTNFIFMVDPETARVARKAFPKGNVYMKIRDELELTYHDSSLTYTHTPGNQLNHQHFWIKAVMQFAEGLTDKQAAQAVAARIDWKYALGLEITSIGFDPSVLSEFRKRLIDGGRERHLFDK